MGRRSRDKVPGVRKQGLERGKDNRNYSWHGMDRRKKVRVEGGRDGHCWTDQRVIAGVGGSGSRLHWICCWLEPHDP